jgi:hypothetical protein
MSRSINYARFMTLLLFAALLSAADGGIEISAHNSWVDERGFTPVVVRIKSPYSTVIQLRGEDNQGSFSHLMSVQANSETTATILLPPLADDHLYLHQLSWKSDNGFADTVSVSRLIYSSSDELTVLLLDPKEQIRLNELNKLYDTRKGSSSRDIIKRLAPTELPDRWQAYPAWLVLLLTPAGDSELSASQRHAMAQWTRMGGQLFITNKALHLAWEQFGARAQYLPTTTEAFPLFARAISQSAGHKNWSGAEHTVPGLEAIPVKSFIVLAIVFALIVGPLNLWWVRRRNARQLLLITTPLFSFITCVALIGIALFSDGIATKRSAIQFILLDQTQHTTARWTGASYFGSFATTSLSLDANTALHRLGESEPSYRRSRNNNNVLHLAWSNEPLITGSFIPARTPQQWAFTELKPDKRRVLIERQGDNYRLTNGLGIPLTQLRWRDHEKNAWVADQVAAGETVTLQRESLAEHKRDADIFSPEDWSRLPPLAGVTYKQKEDEPFILIANSAQLMDQLPGPACVDAVIPASLLMCLVSAHGSTHDEQKIIIEPGAQP